MSRRPGLGEGARPRRCRSASRRGAGSARPIITAMPAARQAAAAAAVVGNSAMRAPWVGRGRDLGLGRVVVAGERRAEAAGGGDDRRLVARRRLRAPRARMAGDVRLELVLGHAAAADGVVLAAWSMSVNWRWPGVWSIRLTMPTPSSGANSASSSARVSEQASARRCSRWRMRRRRRRRSRGDRGGERAGVLAVAGLAAVDERADAERVEDGGDAGSRRARRRGRGSPAPAGQRTPGRGSRWRSRLSVWSSTRPGARKSPPRSSAPRGTAAPVSTAAMRPSRTARLPVTVSVVEDEAGVGEDQLALIAAGGGRVAWPLTDGDTWASGGGMQSISRPPAGSRWRASARNGSAGTRRRAGPAAAGLPALPRPRAALVDGGRGATASTRR